MKKIVLASLYLFFSMVLVAQNETKKEDISTAFSRAEEVKSENDILFISRTANGSSEEEREEWQETSILDNTNKKHQIKGRYCIKRDEFQILVDDQKKVIFPQKIKAIKIGEMVFVPADYATKESLAYGYFRIVSDGEIKLLDRFENVNGSVVKQLYTRKEGEAAYLLKQNKKSVFKVIGTSAVKQFYSRKGLCASKKEDLKILFDFYNASVKE